MSEISRFIVRSRQTKVGLDSQRRGLSEVLKNHRVLLKNNRINPFTVFSLQLFRCRHKQDFRRKKHFRVA